MVNSYWQEVLDRAKIKKGARHLRYHRRLRKNALKKLTKNPKFGLACQRSENLKKRMTYAEKVFRQKLKKQALKFKCQKFFTRGKCFAIVDFYIPARALCIEIDGEYHNDPQQQTKDKWRDLVLLKEYNVKVVRLTNQQAFEIKIEEIQELLDSYKFKSVITKTG